MTKQRVTQEFSYKLGSINERSWKTNG